VYNKKSIDDKSWRSRFLDITRHIRNFASESKFQFVVDDQSLSVQTNLVNLLHLRARTRAVLIHDEHVADWVTDSFLTPFVTLGVVMPTLNAMATEEYVADPAFIQLSHILAAALEPVMKSRHFQIVVEDLIRRAANRAPAEAREASYQKLHQAHLLKQVQIEAALFIMKTVGLTADIDVDLTTEGRHSEFVKQMLHDACGLSDDQKELEISSIYANVLKKSHYYQHLIGAALADIDRTLEELE
jgi:hypothetical protein